MGDYLNRTGAALSAPSQSMSWTQLAAATVFVLVVILAWRQIMALAMGELY